MMLVWLCLVLITLNVSAQDDNTITSYGTYEFRAMVDGPTPPADPDVQADLTKIADCLATQSNITNAASLKYEFLLKIRRKLSYKFTFNVTFENVETSTDSDKTFANYMKGTCGRNLKGLEVLLPRSIVPIDTQDWRITGDPHVYFTWKGINMCFDILDPLNENLQLFNMDGVVVNGDFSNENQKMKGKKIRWLEDIAIITDACTEKVERKQITVINNTDLTSNTYRWKKFPKLEFDGCYMDVHNDTNNKEPFLFYLMDDEDNFKLAIFIDSPGAGLGVAIESAFGTVDTGFLSAVMDNIGTVTVSEDKKTATGTTKWDSNVNFEIEWKSGQFPCYYIKESHTLFQGENWQKYVMESLTSRNPKVYP